MNLKSLPLPNLVFQMIPMQRPNSQKTLSSRSVALVILWLHQFRFLVLLGAVTSAFVGSMRANETDMQGKTLNDLVTPFSGTPEDALAIIRNYTPVDIPNGCLIEAVLFADWYMLSEFNGPKSWATVVWFTTDAGNKQSDHAGAVFQFGKEFYLWEINRGILRLNIERYRGKNQKPVVLATVAKSEYERARKEILRDMAAVRLGNRELPKIPLNGTSARDNAIHRLASTRPVVSVTFNANGKEVTAIAFLFENLVFVYNEEILANGGEKITDAAKLPPYIKATLQKFYPTLKDFKITKTVMPRR